MLQKLCVLFPGLGYNIDKPLLYYAKKLAIADGYDVISVDYSQAEFPEKIRGDKEKTARAIELVIREADRCLADIDMKKYAHVIFVAKSIGTVAAAAWRDTHGFFPPLLLYTPLRETFGYSVTRSLCFHGTRDPWADAEDILSLCRDTHIPAYTYDNANHSLETGDILHDLTILTDVMQHTKDILKDAIGNLCG